MIDGASVCLSLALGRVKSLVRQRGVLVGRHWSAREGWPAIDLCFFLRENSCLTRAADLLDKMVPAMMVSYRDAALHPSVLLIPVQPHRSYVVSDCVVVHGEKSVRSFCWCEECESDHERA